MQRISSRSRKYDFLQAQSTYLTYSPSCETTTRRSWSTDRDTLSPRMVNFEIKITSRNFLSSIFPFRSYFFFSSFLFYFFWSFKQSRFPFRSWSELFEFERISGQMILRLAMAGAAIQFSGPSGVYRPRHSPQIQSDPNARYADTREASSFITNLSRPKFQSRLDRRQETKIKTDKF